MNKLIAMKYNKLTQFTRDVPVGGGHDDGDVRRVLGGDHYDLRLLGYPGIGITSLQHFQPGDVYGHHSQFFHLKRQYFTKFFEIDTENEAFYKYLVS